MQALKTALPAASAITRVVAGSFRGEPLTAA
jgi:hypothetical protein